MNTAEEFGQYLQDIIDRHRKDLSILLRRHGIESEPTPALLVVLYDEYGDEFIEMMEELPIENYTGLDFRDLLTKGRKLLGKVSDVTGAVAGTAGSGTKPKDPPPPEKSKTKKIVIIGIAIVVVLTIILIVVNRKK
jgi:hypothetical protein